MSTREVGKQRAAGVPLEYHRRGAWLKWLLIAAATLPPAAWGIASFVGGHTAGPNSPGTVHAVHATWNDECSVCHVFSQPTSSDNFAAPWLRDPAGTDFLCRRCHEGPPHYADQKVADQ